MLKFSFSTPKYFTGLNDPIAKEIYGKLDGKLQKWFKILSIGMVTITPICVTLPSFIASVLRYFYSDLGAAAFQLPFPLW